MQLRCADRSLLSLQQMKSLPRPAGELIVR
jgi:hypothetical protein